jgi:nucleotide-binding universal stress UspA family protein
MYKHILVPTDGTELSMAAIRSALSLAKALGSRVTVLRVSGKPAHIKVLGVDLTELPEETRARIRKDIEDHFTWVRSEAAARGVACETVRVESDFPWTGILEEARARGCDLIAMASHGRAGLMAKVLGSETQKVLVHSTLPVLVYR